MSSAITNKGVGVFVALIPCLHLSACDHLSEKDKMEMITMCDTMARRQIKEKDETEQNDLLTISKTTEVTTHYSFKDSRCYAQESDRVLFVGGNNPEPTVWWTETLYDGMTKEKLLAVGLLGPFDGVSGSLKTKGMTKDEAKNIIKEKMKTP